MRGEFDLKVAAFMAGKEVGFGGQRCENGIWREKVGAV